MLAGTMPRKSEMSKLNENTFVSLSIVAAVVLVVFAMGQSYSKIDENASELNRLEIKVNANEDKLTLILQSLARIEERLEKSKK